MSAGGGVDQVMSSGGGGPPRLRATNGSRGSGSVDLTWNSSSCSAESVTCAVRYRTEFAENRPAACALEGSEVMSMKRYWAIYDVYLGNPVLVERCATKEGAMRFIEQRGLRSCGALYLVEQLLPDGPRLVPPSNGTSASDEGNPAAR
jgi:hypothetical protein